MHVYCDACVKGAQKKKIRTDHTNALRKVFSTLEKQEKVCGFVFYDDSNE